MSLLITIVIVLVVFGLLMWLINSILPIDPKIKTVINVLLILILVIWLIRALWSLPEIRL